MDLKPFKLDIDDLISEFAEGGSTTLAEMKRVWLSKKFSFIFEASPSTNQACFMQSLFAYSVGYAVSTRSLSHRLGGLYCLYCLFETQPFKPPFKIYLSLDLIKQRSTEYAMAKKQAIEEASKAVDIENIKHIVENKRSIGETIEQKGADWNAQKDAFYQQTGCAHQLAMEPVQQEEPMQVDENLEEAGELQEDDNDEFGKELEDVLLSEQLLLENEEEAEDFEQD
nr:Small nuclear RNA activating complex (SNAPc), subunit SNAP43 [Ipomoea batatas]